jgi:hypothetical protein
MSRTWISVAVLCACLWPAAAHALGQEPGGFAGTIWVVTVIVVVVGYSLSKVQPWAGFIVYPFVLYTAYKLAMELTNRHVRFDQEEVMIHYAQAIGATALQFLVPIVGYVKGRKAQ